MIELFQPTLYNTTTGVYVSYDDVPSFALKGGFIHTAGLGGFAMWEAGGDLNDALLNSIRKSLGWAIFWMTVAHRYLACGSECDPEWWTQYGI